MYLCLLCMFVLVGRVCLFLFDWFCADVIDFVFACACLGLFVCVCVTCCVCLLFVFSYVNVD